jgi:hypothetical protein
MVLLTLKSQIKIPVLFYFILLDGPSYTIRDSPSFFYKSLFSNIRLFAIVKKAGRFVPALRGK